MKKKYELTDKIKKNIIEYSFYILDNKVKLEILKEHDINHAFFLEMTYFQAVKKFEIIGKYELESEEVEHVFKELHNIVEIYKAFRNDKIELIAIFKDDTLLFNFEPDKKTIYNKKTKKWEYKQEINE